MNDKIDFVVLWVDGNDPLWQKEKKLWNPDLKMGAKNRFRDWDNMQYWFRAVEKFTPWVNKIHFVTWGHLPSFLNKNHPKLHITKHSDFLPQDVLPTFSCNPLELNMHRIPGLENQFVFFNDDMFITRGLSKEFFFKNGKPCDQAIFNALIPDGEQIFQFRANDMAVVNKHLCKKKCLRKNFLKYYSLKYGGGLYRSIALTPWNQFTGFYDDHLPIAYLKETREEVWDKESEILQATTHNKFRTSADVTNWVFRYWRLAKGDFVPCRNRGQLYEISGESISVIEDVITSQKKPMVCLNDSDPNMDFETLKERIKNAFDKILPEKSSFEN